MGLPFFVSFRFLIQGPSILRQPLLLFLKGDKIYDFHSTRISRFL